MKTYHLQGYKYRLNESNELCLIDNKLDIKDQKTFYIQTILRNRHVSYKKINNLFEQIGKGIKIARIWVKEDAITINLYTLTFDKYDFVKDITL